MWAAVLDYLVQHMGNFHNYVDKYLAKNSFRILNQVRPVNLWEGWCRSGSGSEFSFWCRSGSRTGLSKRCRSTSRFFPKFYTCWKIGWKKFTLIHSLGAQVYNVFLFSSKAPQMCRYLKNTCAWILYRSGSGKEIMRIRTDPDPQQWVFHIYVQRCVSATLARGSGSCLSGYEVQF
jgi:hypothetical protein